MLGTLSVTRSRLIIAWLAMGVCTAAAAQDTAYYKWTDAAGTVHFSASPPAVGKAAVVQINEENRSRPAEAASLPSVAPTPDLAQAQAAYREQSCTAARHDLRFLQGTKMVVSGSSPDAAAKLDAAQREQAKLRAQQRMVQFCQPGKTP